MVFRLQLCNADIVFSLIERLGMLTRMSNLLVPNNEPSSLEYQEYQESCIHSAFAEDAVVPPSDHALKACWY
jgi:hypothetical protein